MRNTRVPLRWAFLLCWAFVGHAALARPLPPTRFYGDLVDDGVTVTTGNPQLNAYQVRAYVQGQGGTTPIATYTLGSNPAYGAQYLIEVALNTDGPLANGDRIELWVNDRQVSTNVTLQSGVSVRKNLSFSFDRAPVLDAIPAQTIDEGQPLSFSVHATDADGDPVTYSAQGLPAGAQLNSSTGAFTFTPTFEQAGTYVIAVRATARNMVDEESFTLTVREVDVPPSLSPLEPSSMAEQETLTFTLAASDPDGDPITYAGINLPAGATLNATTGVFSFTPGYDFVGTSPSSRTVSMTFTATSGQASDQEPFNLTVVNVDRPPALSVASELSVEEGVRLQYQVSALDPDGDPVSCSATGLPSGAAFANCAIDFTPGFEQAGSYPITFSASANGETSSAASMLVVQNVDRPPSVASIGNRMAVVGNTLIISVVASDPDGDAITLSATGVPANATFNPSSQEFRFTPSSAQGGIDYTVTFFAQSQSLSDQEVVQIHVNAPPVLSQIGSQTVAEGAPLELDLVATDAENDAISFAAESLPAGATLDPSTGFFRWVPQFDQAGTYQLVFQAVTDYGSDAETVSIEVTNTDRVPQAGAVGRVTLVRGETLSFYLRGLDPDGTTVSYTSVSTLPSGVTLNSASGKVEANATLLTSGTYNLSFRVTSNGLYATIPVTLDVLARYDRRQSTEDEGTSDEERWSVFLAQGGAWQFEPANPGTLSALEATERSHALLIDTHHVTLTSNGAAVSVASGSLGGSGSNPQRRLLFIDDAGPVLVVTGGNTVDNGSYDIHLISDLATYDAIVLGENPVWQSSSSRLCSTWVCGSDAPHELLAPRQGACQFDLTITNTEFRFQATALDSDCLSWDSGWVPHDGELTSGQFAVGIEGVAHGTETQNGQTIVVPQDVGLFWSDWSTTGPDASCEELVATGAPGTGTVKLSCPDWSDVPVVRILGSASEAFGAAVALGDYDEDGYPDLAVAAPGYDGGRGRVLIFDGLVLATSSTLTSADAVTEFVGVAQGDGFGTTLALIDVGGQLELAIGAPGAAGGDGEIAWVDNQDLVSVGQAGTVTGWFDCGTPFGGCGSAMAKGDVDGDGSDDLIAGAPEVDEGSVVVFRGGQPESGGEPWRTLTGEHVDSRFGAAVAVGDLDGLIGEELLIGAPDSEAPGANGTDQGALWVYDADTLLGASAVVPIQDASAVRYGPGPGDRLGTSLLVADFNGDTTPDGLAGSPGCEQGCPGRVFWWSGSELVGGATPQNGEIMGFVEGEAFGTALSAAAGQLLIGAPDAGNGLQGAIYRVRFGYTSIEASTTGLELDSRFGSQLTAAARLGGD